MASTRRKAAAAGLAVIGIAGLSLAAAAQLNVDAGLLGAATEIIASCQPVDDGVGTPEPAIEVSYTNEYDSTTDDRYETTAVVLTGVAAACAGQAIDLTLTEADGTVLANGTVAAAAAGTNTVTLSAAVDAELVENLAIVIAD